MHPAVPIVSIPDTKRRLEFTLLIYCVVPIRVDPVTIIFV
jgi:hypothetical protein